ncbi:MAG: DUF3142 domain-containing protein [Novosphingobium sp.]
MVRLALAILLALAACGPAGDEPRVDPARYDSFFLWAGVEPPAYFARAKTVYLLAGEVRAGGRPRLVSLRATPSHAKPALWLVIRAERLDWDDALHSRIGRTLARWRAAGNRVEGVQVDFDARTKGLAGYAAFLADLRRRLPRDTKLSVTGLMDWGANGDPASLASLVGVVDEVVVQTYQGRTTIPGYERYFERLARLPVPHKVALVEGGEWTEPPALARDPRFRGYVVFLLAPKRP